MNEKDRVDFAAKIRAHISTLASTEMKMSLIEWNTIAGDLFEAADLIQNGLTTS